MKKKLQSPIPPGTNFDTMAEATRLLPYMLKDVLRGPRNNPDIIAILLMDSMAKVFKAYRKTRSEFKRAYLVRRAIDLATIPQEMLEIRFKMEDDIYDGIKDNGSAFDCRYREISLSFISGSTFDEAWNFEDPGYTFHTSEINTARKKRLLELVPDFKTAVDLWDELHATEDHIMWCPFLLKAIEIGTPEEVLTLVASYQKGMADRFDPQAPACRLAIQKILPLFQQ